jgi:phosphate transport system permease protein
LATAVPALAQEAGAGMSQDALSPFVARLLFAAAVLAGLVGAYVMGRNRARAMRAGVAMHSLPNFHGAVTMQYAALGVALALIGFEAFGRPMGMAGAAMAAGALGLLGAGFGLSTAKPEFRARTFTERSVMAILILCSLVAVLITVGIVASLLFETAHFFRLYPAADFFLSTEWTPKFNGGSALGIWPLIWGTLYVSAIALIVAVPIGLMSAIYLAEYASGSVRSWVKPAIEILAGIPTIVYGLFALITVGPLLRDYFAQPMGFGNSASSVMTAGLVMGIMVIPFVSSLSDDIINAVPQSLRDGSLGLGATPSETVRNVVIPAALPGIVGAVLLAASRAIGETMIVVMGAGAAARMSLNPFEAMTTVTVKIVSQLTGDTEFASPETLVAFALGLTLFVLTLGLNVLALVIVRKYREQYE